MTDAEKCRAVRDADPWDTGPKPFNADDAVMLAAAVALAWLSCAAWFYWPPFA
jgi:hypothetical protein